MNGWALQNTEWRLVNFCDRPIGQQRIVVIVLSAVVGLFAHIAFLLVLPEHWQKNQSSDYFSYYAPVAENVINGKGLVLASKPALQYPPGIPLMYAATFWGSDVAAMSRGIGLRVLEAFCVMSSSALVGLIGIYVFNLKIALAASVLWSTYPFHLWLTKQPNASAALTTLLLSAVFLFLLWTNDPRRPLRCGLALGGILAIAALVKPFTIALPIVFLCLVWLCDIRSQPRQRWIFSVGIVVAYILLILPWEVWAWRASGQWIPLCTNGPNVLIDGLTFGTVRGLQPVPMPEGVRALTQDAIAHYPNLKSTSSIMRFFITYASENPTSVIELILLKAGRSWYGSESHSFENTILLTQLCYLPFVASGLRRSWLCGPRQRNLVIAAMGVVLYFWAMIVFTALPILRYMIPPVSLLLLCAATIPDISEARA